MSFLGGFALDSIDNLLSEDKDDEIDFENGIYLFLPYAAASPVSKSPKRGVIRVSG